MMSGLVGQGSKAKAAKRLTAHILRTADGFEVTIEHRRGFMSAALLAALDVAAARVRGEVAAANEAVA